MLGQFCSKLFAIRRRCGSRANHAQINVEVGIELLEARTLMSAAGGLRLPVNPDLERSSGPQTHLVVRVELLDDGFWSGYEYSDEMIRESMSQVNDFQTRQSFGKLTFPDELLTIVPGTITLPFTEFQVERGKVSFDAFFKAAAKEAFNQGFDVNNYLHVTLIHPYLNGPKFDYLGIATTPGSAVMLNDTVDPEVWAHELTHNAGMPHAGHFEPNDSMKVVDAARRMNYVDGDTGLDLMDSVGLVGIETNGDLFVLRKAQLGWLDVGTNLVDVTQTGTYRLYATDDGTESDDRTYGLRIRRNATQEYWLEYRTLPDDPLLQNGVVVTLHNYGGNKKLGLLDMTPDSQWGDFTQDGADAPLEIGETFSDGEGLVHIMPLDKHSEDGGHFIDVKIVRGLDVTGAAITVADAYTLKEDTSLSVRATGVLKNDLDADRRSLRAELVDAPQHGTLTLRENGSFVYQPVANFAGTDSFTYQALNGQVPSLPTTVTITVQPVADAPTLTVPATLSGAQDQAIALPITAALNDQDGSETLTLIVSGLPAWALLNHGFPLPNGTWQLSVADLSDLSVHVTEPGKLKLSVQAISTETIGGLTAKSTKRLGIKIN